MFTIDMAQKQSLFAHKIPTQKILEPQRIREMEDAVLINKTASNKNLWPFVRRAFLLSDFPR